MVWYASFDVYELTEREFSYISQNFIMASIAAFERNKLHQILKTASISPWHLTYVFVGFF